MDNEQAFEAEARMDAEGEASSPHLSPGYKAGPENNSRTSSYKVKESPGILYDENTPLLSRYGSNREDIHEDGLSEEEPRTPPAWSGERDFVGVSWWRRPSVFWLIPPFLTYTLAFGGIIVPKLNLILTLICSEYLPEQALIDPNFQFMPVIFGDDNPQCQIPEVQARVARFILYGSMIAGILSAITSPKLGVLSDRYGRVKILVITTSGTLVGEVITIIAATHPETVPYRWLLLGYASEGICGSFIAAMAISNAYAADCTEPSRRAVTFAYLYGCLFTGIAIGPIAAGYIVKLSGQLVTVFFVALGAHIFFLAFLIFLIPESLTVERMLSARQKPEVVGGDVAWTWRHSMRRLSYAAGFSTRDPEDGPLESWRDPLSQLVHVLPWLRRGGGLLSPLSVLWPSGPGSSAAVRRNLVMLAAVDTVMFGVAMGSMTIVVLYSEYMFGWGNFESSRFLSIVNTSRVSILIIVLPLVTRLVRGPRSTYVSKNSGSDQLDLALIRTAIAFDIIGYVGFAASQNGNMLTASGVIASIGGMGSPTLASSMTKHVPAERTGQLLGAVGLLHALARVVAPTLFNLIYAETVVREKPQIVFICLAATFGVAFIMSWFIRPHVYFEEPDHPIRPGTAEDEDIAPEVMAS